MIGHKAVINKRHLAYWMSAPHLTRGLESVLMIHGYGGTYSGLEELSDSLAGEFNVLGVDLPGYGLSEPLRKKHSLQNYAHFLDYFCAHTEFHTVTVIGHSFGADIALVFAALHPGRVDKLVLISPVTHFNKYTSVSGRAFYKLVASMPNPLRRKVLHNHFVTWLSDTAMFKSATEQQRARILRDDYINDHLMSAQASIEGYMSLLSTPFMKLAARIQSPTLLLGGTDDPLTPVAELHRLHRAIPGSQLETFDGEGHFLPLESPRLVSKSIINFLR